MVYTFRINRDKMNKKWKRRASAKHYGTTDLTEDDSDRFCQLVASTMSLATSFYISHNRLEYLRLDKMEVSFYLLQIMKICMMAAARGFGAPASKPRAAVSPGATARKVSGYGAEQPIPHTQTRVPLFQKAGPPADKAAEYPLFMQKSLQNISNSNHKYPVAPNLLNRNSIFS